MIKNNTFIHKTPIPAGADAPAGHKIRLVKLAGTLLLAMMFGFGAVYVHKLPLVQDVKKSFRHSDVNIAAITFGDENTYGEILSRGPQYR